MVSEKDMDVVRNSDSEDGENGVQLDLSKLSSKQHIAYVLITCEPPNDDGKMSVEMTYEGDPSLAAYLVESAQSFFEEDSD